MDLPSTKQVWVGATGIWLWTCCITLQWRSSFQKLVSSCLVHPYVFCLPWPHKDGIPLGLWPCIGFLPLLCPIFVSDFSLGSFFQPRSSLFSSLNTDALSNLQHKLIPLPGVPSTLHFCCPHSPSHLNPAQASDLSFCFFTWRKPSGLPLCHVLMHYICFL